MRKLRLATTALLALTSVTKADVVIEDDPLHGFCTGCVDNQTNTPIFQAPGGTVQQFGFTVSPGKLSGNLTIDVLIPNNINLAAFQALNPKVTSTSILGGAAAVTLFNDGFGAGLTQWKAGGVEGNNPLLSDFLGNLAKVNPADNLNAYLTSTRLLETSEGVLPGDLATGFFVFQLSGLGPFDLPGPGGVPTDLFNLSNTVPDGSYIVGFLSGTNNKGPFVIGTANSAALFVNPTAAVPEASTWAMMLLGFAAVSVFGMRGRVGSRRIRLIST